MAVYYGFKNALMNSTKKFIASDLIIEYDDNDVSLVKLKTGPKTGKELYKDCSYLSGNGSSVSQYERNKQYRKDELVYIGSELKRVNSDFISDDSHSNDSDAFISDITAGNLIDIVEEPEIPICLGSIKTDNSLDFPTNPVSGNWVLIEDCVNTASTQAGIGVFNGTTWDILPIPTGTFTFPEPPSDSKYYFRKVDTGNTTGSWEAFTEVSGNDIEVTIKQLDGNTNDQVIIKSGELVYDTARGIIVVGDGTKKLGQLQAFYSSTLTKNDIISLLTYTPEDVSNKGQANGYAPLDANGLVPTSHLPAALTNVYSKIEVDTKDTDTLNSATTLVNTEATRATGVETGLRTDLDAHTSDTAIHVTQSEKDGWDAKVDQSDLTGYDNHLADTAIHVTQADKDKWNGMNTAYYVLQVSDLPTTDVNVGSMGYVQTSAAGVTPVVCDQYIWDGSAWQPYDAGQISLQFNWGNIQGKPSSTPLSIDNAITVAHNHANRNVLNKIGQSPAGNFTYNGVEIGVRVVFLDNENLLPAVGEVDTLYVIYIDSRVRNYPSISVYRDGSYQILGRGTQDAAPVVGDMSILQSEYYSVVAGSTYKITITPNKFFAFMPVEILREIEGLKNQTKVIVPLDDPSEYKYDEDLLVVDQNNKLKIDIKEKKTNLDTVADIYYSSVDVDLSYYKDVDSIE